MDNVLIRGLAAANPLMSSLDKLMNIFWGSSSVMSLNVPGDILEIGCNSGHTSVLLAAIIEHVSPERTLHVYDSFQGLPAPSGPDSSFFAEGDCQSSLEELRSTLLTWGARTPVIHPGWFKDTIPEQLPGRVAFAYVDADLFESTYHALRHIYPRLSVGGLILIDDYCDRALNPTAWSHCPGVKTACDQFFADKPERVCVLAGNDSLAMGAVRKLGRSKEAP